MKTHTNDYKNKIKTFGKQLDSIITYTQNGETIELGNNNLNSVSPIFEGSILKSSMKQLDIDSNTEIPVGTMLNYQLGVKVRDEEVEDYKDNYDYIDFGNYIVKEVEKQKDTNSYKITCYDKMLYSMVDYDLPNITYPITVRNYLNAICQKLGLTFASVNDTFANYNRQINEDLYKEQGYTFRDVLDELAQVTGSTICINANDELEVRYITDTHDTINEDYLKNINVTFGERYGPVNSIVLSRSAESDNVYIQDQQSITQNGLCEIKITDNQIMNFNDRADYLPDLLSKLDGLQYYLNDFSSTGITYYDLCDRYAVQVGEETYSCVMLNDEINITQGLEENVYTEIPKESVTDYTKADKTDRKINQTYLIVDKQNQTIEGVVTRVDGQDEQIAQIRLQYNEILSRISDIADITTSGESSYASVNLVDVNASQPIDIKIHPITEHIAYDYPHNDYPQIDYCKSRTLRFTNTSEYIQTTDVKYTNYKKYYSYDGTTYTLLVLGTDYNANDTVTGTIYENRYYDWIIPTDLWYYDNTNYDELELSYGNGDNRTVTVTRKCKINADASINLLPTPTTETYSYPDWLVLTDGDYTISLIDNTSGYLYVQLMAKNIYTTQFYTKAETNTLIEQTADTIDLEVNAKLSNYDTTEEVNGKLALKVGKNENEQIVSMINASANDITLTGNRVAITSDKFSLNYDGVIEATAGDIGGFAMNSTSFKKNLNGIYNYSLEDVALAFNIVLGALKQNTNIDYILDYDNSGEVDLLDAQKILRILNGLDQNTRNVQGVFEINSNDLKNCLLFKNNNGQVSTSIGLGGINTEYIYTKNFACGKAYTSGTIFRGTTINSENGQITINDGTAQTIIKAGEIVLRDGQGNVKTITASN